MKRAFKVATAFTGVAACATVMAPAADAGTAVPFTANNCTLAEANWVHLYYSVNQHHPTPACFGNNGANRLTNNQKFSAICTGNNSGEYYSSNGIIRNFYPGSDMVFPTPRLIWLVDIVRHTASYSLTC